MTFNFPSSTVSLRRGACRSSWRARSHWWCLPWMVWGVLFGMHIDLCAQQIIPQPVSEIMETGELDILADLLKEERPEYARLRFAEEEDLGSAGWDSWHKVKHFIYKRRFEDPQGFLYLDGDFRWVVHDLDSLRNISRSKTKDQSLNAYPTVYMENFAWVGGYGYFRFHRNWWVLQANGGVSFWKDRASPLSLENFESAPPNVVHGIWRDDKRGVYCYFTNRHALDEPNSPDASNEMSDSLKAVTSRFQLWEDLDFGEDQNSFRHVADVNLELFGEAPPIGMTETKSWVILHHSNQWTQGAKVSFVEKETRNWYFLKQDHSLSYGEKEGLFGWMIREDSLLVVSSGKVAHRIDLNSHIAQYETTQPELLNRKNLLFVAPQASHAPQPWKERVLILAVALILASAMWLAFHSKQSEKHQLRLQALDTQLEVIGYFSRSIFRSTSADDILQDIATRCISILGFDVTSVYMRDGDRNRWVRKAQSSGGGKAEQTEELPDVIGMNDGLVGSVGMSGSAEIISNRKKDSRVLRSHPSLRSELAVPIVCDGQVIGVIDCLKARANSFDTHHLKVIQNIANICGQTIGRSQSELRTKELAQVYEENPGPVLRLNREGMVLLSNKSAKRHFGEAAMLGETLQFQELVSEAQLSLEQEQVRFIKFNHGARMYQLHLLPSMESDCINVYASDVTELEQARTRAEKAERAKSDFLSVMSHEIRTPLNAIIGLNDLLLKEDLTEEQKKQLIYMQYSGRHLLTLINHVLSLESLDSGKATLNAEVLNLATVLEGIAGSFRARAQELGTSIEVESPPEEECWVLADRRWLSQMLNNVVDNAVKFTQRGNIKVSARKSGKSDMWKVSISDSGSGIPREHLQRILDPFEQVLTDSKNTLSNQGTGLGLAIVKRLAALHGGTLSVQSTLGVGSTFVLDLNMPQREKPASESIAQSKWSPENNSASPLKILIVDDNQVNLLVAQKMVESLGDTAVTETNGLDAIQAWLRETPDIILMDVQMPGMDGIEATAEIRRLSEESNKPHVPIVALTADAENATREGAMVAGVDKFVVKPIDTSELSKVLLEVSR